MNQLFLIRDVLDNQLIDLSGQNAGKVDGIVLELRVGAPPLVRFVESGPVTLARRLNRRLGALVARLDARFGPGRGEPIRIPIARMTPEGPSLRLDFSADPTPLMAFENWLRRKIIDRIPGS
jgi:hypothetical protein